MPMRLQYSPSPISSVSVVSVATKAGAFTVPRGMTREVSLVLQRKGGGSDSSGFRKAGATREWDGCGWRHLHDGT